MKTYTFAEYKQMQDLNNIDRFIGNLKKNKKEYAKLLFVLAVFIPSPTFAATTDLGLSEVAGEILHMGAEFAKYGCTIKGVINMVNSMLEGANLKEAISEGIGYFVFYIILSIYPVLFSMVKF